MIEYIKIDTPFKRDMDGTKKLLEDEYRDTTVEILKSHAWIWTEKIDGTNIAVEWDGHKVSLHGRTERASIPKYLLEVLEELFCTDEAEEMFEQLFGADEVYLYGEGYGGKIQGNLGYRDDCSFILFDIYKPQRDLWFSRAAKTEIASAFGVECVPIIFIGTLDEAVRYVKKKPKSTIGTADMEGLVGVPLGDLKDKQGKRIITKVKVKDFVG